MRQDAGQFDVAVACLTGSVARPRPGGPPGLQSRGSPGGLRCCALQGRFNVPPPSWSHAVVGSASTRGRAALRQGVPMLIVLLLGVAAAPAWGQSGVETTPPAASAQLDNPLGIPDLRNVVPAARDAEGVSASIAILVLLTVLSLAPAILVMMTSFTRMVIVLALLRQAIGTQQLPPSQVVTSLALIMTCIVMAPTWRDIHQSAVEPYLEGRLNQREALDRAAEPLRAFMIRQIENAQNEDDVYLFVEYARGRPVPVDAPLKWSEVRFWELTPAFVLSELKVAFVMGFRLYLPFLVIDMVVSAILISMGMLMLPPVLISLPFKLLLFVIADGWRLVVGALLESFG